MQKLYFQSRIFIYNTACFTARDKENIRDGNRYKSKWRGVGTFRPIPSALCYTGGQFSIRRNDVLTRSVMLFTIFHRIAPSNILVSFANFRTRYGVFEMNKNATRWNGVDTYFLRLPVLTFKCVTLYLTFARSAGFMLRINEDCDESYNKV